VSLSKVIIAETVLIEFTDCYQLSPTVSLAVLLADVYNGMSLVSLWYFTTSAAWMRLNCV